ncbi:MAG: SRPBCC family protein, partial [Aestuariivirga sp.]
MSWASNNPNVGSGSQVITESVPNSRVGVDLDFGAMGKSQAYWDLKPEGTGTSATWGFKMKLDGMMDRWFGLLMDRFIGPDYEKGLARVKALAEKEAVGG